MFLWVVWRREGSLPLQATSVLATGKGDTGTFSSSSLKFLMFSSLLQMHSTKQALKGWGWKPGLQWSGHRGHCPPHSQPGLGSILGQKTQNLPHRGRVVPGPCLVCSALGVVAPGALCGARLLRVLLAEWIASSAVGGREVPKRC